MASATEIERDAVTGPATGGVAPWPAEWRAAALGAGALVVSLVAWAGAPANLARGRPARASSTSFDTVAGGVVDGEREGRFGYHSREENSPWLEIDLERPTAIGTVKVFGRGDCCFDQSTPLALELSDDGVAYRRVAERKEPFSGQDPWVAPIAAKARFVRLRTERRSY